jgi:hypothetical protein
VKNPDFVPEQDKNFGRHDRDNHADCRPAIASRAAA